MTLGTTSALLLLHFQFLLLTKICRMLLEKLSVGATERRFSAMNEATLGPASDASTVVDMNGEGPCQTRWILGLALQGPSQTTKIDANRSAVFCGVL